MNNKKAGRIGATLVGLAGVAMWAFARMPWIDVAYTDEISGSGTAVVRGTQWSTEITAVALLLIAGAIAGFALRSTGRRIIGAVCAAASLAAAFPAGQLLLDDPGNADRFDRVHAILTAGSDASQSGASSAAIAQWAEITSATVLPSGPGLTLACCALGVIGGVVLALRPGTDAPRQNKYEKEAVRMEKVRTDLEEDPSSGRVLWDAISADIDPTDPGQRSDFKSS